MKIKIKYIFLYSTILAILLGGCAEAGNDNYDEAISNGLEEVRVENFGKAKEYFQLALEEESEDLRAETLLKQTQIYTEAVNFFEEEQYQEALKKAKAAQSLEAGSSFLESKISELINEIQSTNDEEIVPEQSEKSEEELFEEFKGTYATFARKTYEWPVDSLFIIGDDFIIHGYQQTGLYLSEITNKTFDGDTLILDTFAEENLSNKEEQYVIQNSHNNSHEKYIHLEKDEVLYPITVDDAIETRFGLINGSFSILDNLRIYDERATEPVSYSNTSVLNDYSAEEIEYARVWLNAEVNHEVSELNVSQYKAGTAINHYDDDSPVYPEDVTVLTGEATADGMVIYSGNGDGTIDIYPVPSHWHAPAEDLPEIYEEILNPTTRFIEPMRDEQVINYIHKINAND